jgi:hypothetical protein
MQRWVILATCVSLLAACNDRAAAPSESGLFFATKPERENTSMAALFRGPLVVRHRCVLIGEPDQLALPVWNPGATAERDDTGRLVVHDGSVTATEGEVFEMGGGFVVEFQPADKVEDRDVQIARLEDRLGYPIPERCLGPGVYGVWWSAAS